MSDDYRFRKSRYVFFHAELTEKKRKGETSFSLLALCETFHFTSYR